MFPRNTTALTHKYIINKLQRSGLPCRLFKLHLTFLISPLQGTYALSLTAKRNCAIVQ